MGLVVVGVASSTVLMLADVLLTSPFEMWTSCGLTVVSRVSRSSSSRSDGVCSAAESSAVRDGERGGLDGGVR